MLAFWFLIIGAILVLMALAGPLVERLPVSAAIIYLALGWALGPAGVGLLAIDPARHGAVVEVLAEIAVLVSLFAVGLKLRIPLERRTWRVPVRLAWWECWRALHSPHAAPGCCSVCLGPSRSCWGRCWRPRIRYSRRTFRSGRRTTATRCASR